MAKSVRESFMDCFNESVRTNRELTEDWIKKLKSLGVKASHPNDGWIDREKKIAFFSYPHFNIGVDLGNKIALGTHHSFIIVEVSKVEVKKGIFGDLKYYHYK